jgi:3-hydroxyisobutyrate dehydrogenase
MPAKEIRSIGFIGLGNMGWPMASRLVAAGHSLTVIDSDQSKVDAFTKEVGGKGAASASDLASGVDAVITMLPTSQVVQSVVDGPTGLRKGFKQGSILIEMSSGAPDATVDLAESLKGAGVHVADAPVSGGVQRAVTGELAIMVGASDEIVARIDPVLRAMGSNIVRTGGVGSAHAMKALNNLVSAGGFLIGIEALLIGKQFGLDPDAMVDILNSSTGMNNATQRKFKQFVLSRKFNSGFGLDLMIKDVSIALQLGKQIGVNTPFAALCRELCASASAILGKGQDHTALAQFSERLAGTSLESSLPKAS